MTKIAVTLRCLHHAQQGNLTCEVLFFDSVVKL